MPRQVLTPFARLKRRVLRDLPKKKLIGDIVVSSDEYALLMEYLRNVYSTLASRASSLGADPLLALALVQVGIKHYDSNYWNHCASELGVRSVSINHRTALNSSLSKTLEEYGMASVGENQLVKNVLLHGFVSHHYADDLFNFLFAFYRLDLERDMARLDTAMMNSLMEAMTSDDNTGRSYLLVKQTAEAIRANPIGSKIRIRRLLRLIDRCFWDGIAPVNSVNRLSRCFVRWQENSLEFKSEYGKYHGAVGNGDRTRSFASPFLRFEQADTRFCLHLPTQLVGFEHERVFWRVMRGEVVQCIDVDLYQGVTGNKTGEATVHIEPGVLFDEFDIELMSGEGRLRRFKISSDCVRFFSKSGYLLSADSLPTGVVYAFTLPTDVIVGEAFTDSVRRGSLLLSQFEFQYGDVLRLPDGKSLSVGKRVEEGLLPRGRVTGAYGLDDEGEQIPIFTRPPTLLVRMLPSRAAGTAIVLNGHQHRFFDETTVEIDINDRSGEKGYIVRLKDYGCNEDGIYRLLVDVPGDRARRSWEFALINEFRFEFEDAPYVFQPRGTVRFPESLQITPDSRTKKLNKENVFNFEISPNDDAIEFAVEGLQVRMYVPALKWRFDEGEWQIEKPSEIWHSDFPTMIYLKHPEDRVTLSLDEHQDDEAEEYALTFHKLKDRHLFACDMTRFRSWFGREAPVRHVQLEFPKDRHGFISVVTRSVVVSATLRGDFVNERLIGDFSIIGQSEYYVDIECNGEPVAEKAKLENERIDIAAPLASGTYRMTVYETEEDDTGFGDVLYLPIGSFNHALLNPHDLRGQNFVIRNVRKGESSIFQLALSCEYYVDRLRWGEEPGKYYARLFARGVSGRILASYDVRVEFPNLERLDIVYLAVRTEDDDYVEFLYDHRRRIIVKDEDSSLHYAERYRRFAPLFNDEYVYAISFAERDSQMALITDHVTNQHEAYRKPEPPQSIWRDEKDPRRMPYEQKLEIRIEDMKLSIKAYNCLRRVGINNIRQIMEYPHTELHRIRNLGYKVKHEILEKLEAFGIDV